MYEKAGVSPAFNIVLATGMLERCVVFCQIFAFWFDLTKGVISKSTMLLNHAA